MRRDAWKGRAGVKRAGIVCVCVLVMQSACADPVDFVNPFVGTTATGHTTPAAAYPLGMVQAGPTTGTITWQYCSGYRHEDKVVTGYALTALSGTVAERRELSVRSLREVEAQQKEFMSR